MVEPRQSRARTAARPAPVQRRSRTHRIGCAGWSIPAPLKARMPPGESHLGRYGQVFSAAEINSSFYRYHEPATYERWRNTVPPGFRFSVKVPREITHFARLQGTKRPLARFLEGATRLEAKLGPLLVQLRWAASPPNRTAFPRQRCREPGRASLTSASTARRRWLLVLLPEVPRAARHNAVRAAATDRGLVHLRQHGRRGSHAERPGAHGAHGPRGLRLQALGPPPDSSAWTAPMNSSSRS